MNRRGFFGALTAAAAGLLGWGKARAATPVLRCAKIAPACTRCGISLADVGGEYLGAWFCWRCAEDKTGRVNKYKRTRRTPDELAELDRKRLASMRHGIDPEVERLRAEIEACYAGPQTLGRPLALPRGVRVEKLA